jgi:hypothetical protein
MNHKTQWKRWKEPVRHCLLSTRSPGSAFSRAETKALHSFDIAVEATRTAMLNSAWTDAAISGFDREVVAINHAREL